MEPKRRREATLAVVVVLLAIAAFAAYQTLSVPADRPSAAGTATSKPQAGSAAVAQPGQPARAAGSSPAGAQEAPQVHLDALVSERPEPRTFSMLRRMSASGVNTSPGPTRVAVAPPSKLPAPRVMVTPPSMPTASWLT